MEGTFCIFFIAFPGNLLEDILAVITAKFFIYFILNNLNISVNIKLAKIMKIFKFALKDPPYLESPNLFTSFISKSAICNLFLLQFKSTLVPIILFGFKISKFLQSFRL